MLTSTIIVLLSYRTFTIIVLVSYRTLCISMHDL